MRKRRTEWLIQLFLVLAMIGSFDLVLGRKPGKCPRKREKEKSCQDRTSECVTDEDCAGLKKCCITFCVKRCVDSIPKPYQKISPRTSLVSEGQSIKLACHLEYQQFEGWYGPSDQKIMSHLTTDNIFVSRKNTTNKSVWYLSIRNVQANHGGTYTCRGTMTKKTHKLRIAFTLENVKLKQFIEESKIGMIEVFVKGYPIPQYFWRKDGHIIDLTAGRFSISPSGSLSIKNVILSDEGIYELTVSSKATNQVKKEYFQVFVILENCPVQTENLITKSTCNTGVFDKCVNDANCGKKYCCFDSCRKRCRGQLFEKKTPGHCLLLSIPMSCASTAKDVCNEDSDCVGKQKCCSNSCYKNCTTPLSLETATSSGVTIFEREEYIKPGREVKRTCGVFNQPFEGWYNPSGNKIMLRHGRVHVRTSGPYHVLVIKNVAAEDGGRYTCQGAIDSKSTNININFTILEMPHMLMRVQVRQQPILIKTFIRGHPVPKYTWYRNGQAIDINSKKYTISPSGSLGIVRNREAIQGTYNLKIEQGGNLYDPDINVELQSTEGTTDVVKRGTMVKCSKNEMRIAIKRNLLEDMQADSLRLRDPSCHAISNETHFLLVAPLVKCGTTVRHTSKVVVYSNAVLEKESKGLITRLSDVSVPFSCFYSKEGITSTVGLLPLLVSNILPGSNSSTNFDLSMGLFKHKTFSQELGTRNNPLSIGLNKPLFIEVRVDSPDVRLAILAERCYATPSQNPYDKITYDVIRKGCGTDPTLKYYPSEPSKKRFSFNSFKFVGVSQTYIFLHCKLVVCNASDPTSRCAQGCTPSESLDYRQKRDLQEKRFDFTQGPVLLVEEKKYKMQQQKKLGQVETLYSSLYPLLCVALVAICIVFLVTIVFLRKRLRIERLSLALSNSKETQL